MTDRSEEKIHAAIDAAWEPKRITGTCAACGRKGHRYGTTHGPDAPDRWDLIACINGLRDEVDQLRDALQRIATYEIPGTGVYRNTDAAEYARRVLDGQT